MMHSRLVIVSWPWGNFGISDHFRMLLDSIFLQKLERAKHEKRWKRIFATLLDGVKCGAGIKQDSICSYPSDILWYSFFTVKKMPWKNVKEERQFTQMSNFDSFNARRPTRQPDPLFGAPRSARKFLFISWSSNLQDRFLPTASASYPRLWGFYLRPKGLLFTAVTKIFKYYSKRTCFSGFYSP